MTVNPGYALGQLARALETAASHESASVRERARAKCEAWRAVIAGMASGGLDIGSRTPVAAPAWATLEVLHGGFASGALLAGGPLCDHEIALAERLGLPAGEERARLALNLHYCSDAGRDELRATLASGLYRVELPEEAALAAVVTLLAARQHAAASSVVEAIAPFFDRLRFYPLPAATPLVPSTVVHRESVANVRAQMAGARVPAQVAAMNETLAVWGPFTDRVAALVLETVEGEIPAFQVDEHGARVLQGRRPAVIGGWPLRREPPDFRERARALVAEAARLRTEHRLARRPVHPKGTLGRLLAALAHQVAGGEQPGARAAGMVRTVLAGHVARHGAPGSEACRRARAEHAGTAGRPTRVDLARVVSARLAPLPPEGGIEALEPFTAPVTSAESANGGPPAGTPLLRGLVRKLERSLEASLEELVERGVLPSGESLARVLPQITSHLRALGIADPATARLYAALDAAFRRRRSLLLLGYAKQVRLDELPWAAALRSLKAADGSVLDASRQALTRVLSIALRSFPYAIVPNPLVAELRSLAREAEVEIPFVDELAADIFMGGFTRTFVAAAAAAGSLLEGTLYERYYGVPYAELRTLAARLPPVAERPRGLRAALGWTTPAVAPGQPLREFAAICQRLVEAGSETRTRKQGTAANGCLIEQQQIVTTQNLVPPIAALGLLPELRCSLPGLADACFVWVCEHLKLKREGIDALRAVKNAAHAWRQMTAFLALAQPDAVPGFLARARAHAVEQPLRLEERLMPLLDGLEVARSGGTPDPGTRFLGWRLGRHPMLG